MRQCRLAAAVRPHERGNFPVPDREIEIIEKFASVDGNVEVVRFEHDFLILN
jgi:hypothetical protein